MDYLTRDVITFFRVPAVSLGASSQVIFAENCIALGILFCNHDTSAHTVTVMDGNGKYFFDAFSIAAGLTFEVDWPAGHLFQGGCYALADADAVVDASFTMKAPDTLLRLPAQTLTASSLAIYGNPAVTDQNGCDCAVRSTLFCNRDTSTHYVTLMDGDGKCFFKSFAIPANTTLQTDWPKFGSFFKSGVFAFADMAGVVDASITATWPGTGA
jgi:hypothetical protein